MEWGKWGGGGGALLVAWRPGIEANLHHNDNGTCNTLLDVCIVHLSDMFYDTNWKFWNFPHTLCKHPVRRYTHHHWYNVGHSTYSGCGIHVMCRLCSCGEKRYPLSLVLQNLNTVCVSNYKKMASSHYNKLVFRKSDCQAL